MVTSESSSVVLKITRGELIFILYIRHCALCKVIHFNPHSNPMMQIPIPHMLRKLRPRETEDWGSWEFAPSHADFSPLLSFAIFIRNILP